MKNQFSSSYLLWASLVILSGILGFIHVGLLDIPGRTAHNVYQVCWLITANMLVTNFIKRSRLAVFTLICGWIGAGVYFHPSLGFVAGYGMTAVFGLLLASSLTMLNYNHIHISASGGSYRKEAESKKHKNSWSRKSLQAKPPLPHETDVKLKEASYDDVHRILPGDTFRFEEGPRWQRTYGEW